MSDVELRELERRYAAGELDILPRLLHKRFQLNASLENAEALFEYQRRNKLPIDLAEAHMLVFSEQSDNVGRLNWIRDLYTVGGIDLIHPKYRFPSLEPVKERSIEIVRKQLPSDDLAQLRKEHSQKLMYLIEVANRFRARDTLLNLLTRFRDTLSELLESFQAKLQEIEENRNNLRAEFAVYLQLLDTHEPLEAGIEWYRRKCEARDQQVKEDILTPDEEVFYLDPPPGGDQGVYAPECYFPFYEFLNDEFSDYAPRANFLAAVSEQDHELWHQDWEEEIKEEELEKFLEERAKSYDVDLEEYKEQYYDYDDDRDFDRYFEEEILPKKRKELIEEVIEDAVDSIVEQYIESSPRMPIKEMWQQLAEGYVEHVDIFFESNDYLDDEWRSEYSLLVDEPFERWRKSKYGQYPVPVVTPLEEYQRSRRWYGKVSERTPWWKLNTEALCTPPPIIKLDTRAIGWRAAFGIEPLIL